MRPTPPKPGLRSASQNDSHLFVRWRLLCALGLLALGASTVRAISVPEYQKQIRQAVTALDTLTLRDETEDVAAYEERCLTTIRGVRNLVPQTQTVEWNGMTFNVDNSWLHQELDNYWTVPKRERPEQLRRITGRLQALEERITEIKTPGAGKVSDKGEASHKLAEILKRPEYARKVTKQSALARLMKQFLEWFKSLFPQPKPLSVGKVGLLTKIAQVFVIVLALAVLTYLARMFLPRLMRNKGSSKKTKQTARIVLGEKLEPNQSATDLLSEAEALARRGELRAAIRKAYIALLVELDERKVISLAQYKTNRDYLHAIREVQPLYRNVKLLTDSFEQHWYGLTHATETDWMTFRSAYDQALRR
jgi:hypothetical protein